MIRVFFCQQRDIHLRQIEKQSYLFIYQVLFVLKLSNH